ncbi:MAG TPA: GNAT family N-acetyltransferase [Iamia sp.]|nr:GNAT family N-acetyltransferase [Iamia sp.]
MDPHTDTDADLTVEVLDGAAGRDGALVARLADLVNDVYVVAEAGLWRDGARRTSRDEMAELIAAGQILVAREPEGRIVGLVHVHPVAEDADGLGMLVADPDRRGVGIGRALVAFAEHHSRARGRRAMHLELLVPREWRHPAKDILGSWYGRIGYRVISVGAMDDTHPHLAPLLATPCDLQLREKPLHDHAGP